MKKSEEYAAATFAAYNEELVTTDTLTSNDEEYIAAAALVTYNEEFHTDKNTVKGNRNFKLNKTGEEGDLLCPRLRDGCNKDEFKLFTLKWRLYIRQRGELDYSVVRQHLLNCIDETLGDAMHDALGYRINTSSVTDMMTELGKLAVDEPFTVEEIAPVVKNMIPEEILIKQTDTHRNQPYSSLSEQTLPRLEDPALTQKLTQEDPALTRKLTQEDPALEQMLAKEDQLSPAAGGSTEKASLHTMPARTQDQLLPAEIQLPKNEEQVPDSTFDLQTTNTSTEEFRGVGTTILQGGQHDRHQRDEGRGYVRLLRKPDPTIQMTGAPVNDATKVDEDMNDNPLDEINADLNSTVEETDTTTPGEETSTNLGGEFENDGTALATIPDEIVKLRAEMITLETSQFNLLTRFLELDTKPLPVKTTEPSDPDETDESTLTEKTTHEPGSIEPRAKAAFDIKTDYEASKMAKTGTDQPEVIREIIETQNMKQTKAPILMPKNRQDGVQWIQLRRESYETKLSVEGKYSEPTTMINIMTNLHKEDSMTSEPLRLAPINKPLDQSQKYEQTAVEIEPHINRAIIKDTFHHFTITYDYENLPPDISIPQLQLVTKEEKMDGIHENTDNNDHDRKFDSTADKNDTTMIAVWKNYEPEVDTIRRVEEEEHRMMKDLTEDEEHDDQLPGRPLSEIPNALAHYKDELAATNPDDHDEELAAALTANGIEFGATSLATDTLDEVLVAVATYKEKFDAITAITDEESTNVTLAHYDIQFDADHDEEHAAALADYAEEFATTHAKYNSTHKQDDAQYQLTSGQPIPRVLFGNKARPKTMEETKRGLEFLHISDNMPRQSGTIDVAKRPMMPDAPLKEKEGEPKMRVTLCLEDRSDEDCAHTVDTPGSRHTYDMEFAAATLATYSDAPVTHHDAEMHVDNTYKYETIHDEEVIATKNEEFAIATLAAYNEETAAVEGEPWGA
jgi:hypothetical protein